MSHLSPEEFVDLADGTLTPSRAAHADTCAACRQQADEIGAALRETAGLDVPEPSPLFWDHFSARVREGVSGTAPSGGWRTRFGAGWIAAAAAAAMVLAVFGGARLARESAPVAKEAAAPTAPASHDVVAIDDTLDSANADVWNVLVAAAADLEFDEAHAAGMTADPSAIDRAVQRMSAEELGALAQLLQSELKRSGD